MGFKWVFAISKDMAQVVLKYFDWFQIFPSGFKRLIRGISTDVKLAHLNSKYSNSKWFTWVQVIPHEFEWFQVMISNDFAWPQFMSWVFRIVPRALVAIVLPSMGLWAVVCVFSTSHFATTSGPNMLQNILGLTESRDMALAVVRVLSKVLFVVLLII